MKKRKLNNDKVEDLSMRTERKLENLEEESRILATIVHDSNDAIIQQDLDGKILAWNKGAEKIFRYSAKEITGKSIFTIIPDDKVEEEKQFRDRIIKGKGVPSFETQRKTKEGKILAIWMVVTKICDADGNPMGLVTTERDITELKQAEESLKESETSLRDTQRIANIGNWSFDLNTGNVHISEEMLNVIGIKNKSEDMHVSQHEKYYTQESWKVFQNALKEAQEKGKSYKIELEFSNKDAEFRYAIARGEPVYDENNNLKGLKGTLQDITEHKQAENQIQRDLKEKTLLLQEIHHRTKNNLQMICSLMQMQENTIRSKEDALKGFKVTQDRIRTMAKAYEILLRSEYMSELELCDYITELANELARNYDIHGKVHITYSMDNVLYDA
jgi:hypothetical protein